ncbi:MAG: DEAD/DEAH box helicase [Oscillospiraceae bacterium]
MNNLELVSALNEYSFSGENDKILEILNKLFDSGEYKAYLNLVFNAISLTQMYGFLAYLDANEKAAFLAWDRVRSASYVGRIMPYYNSGQLSLLLELERYQKIFLSAPTSFGKTSLLLEFIIQNYVSLSNVLMIVPTNSLLEELYIKLIDNNRKFEMNYCISTQPYFRPGLRNFLVVTPERFLLLCEGCDLSAFDIIVMDETYKIVDSHNEYVSDFIETRSVRFRKVADMIGQTSNRLVLLSPFTYELTDSMGRYLARHGIRKIDRKIEYVNKEIYPIVDAESFKKHFKIRVVGYTKTASIPDKTNVLLRVLQDDKNIVYVSQYTKAYDIVEKLNWTRKIKVTERYLKFIAHLEKAYSIDDTYEWKIISALKKGVGIYISPLPRYIKREIISLFEEGVIGTLIVTTSFTDGVNTSASNLIFTSLLNGPTTNKLSDIDVLNVSGRAGRFTRNSIGKVYCITPEVYEKVSQLQREAQIKLENYNYCMQEHKRIDYEIDMIEDEYLSEDERVEKAKTLEDMLALGLTAADLRLSLNVSTKWKIALYKYFRLHTDQIITSYEKAKDILEAQPSARVDSLNYIFGVLKAAFEAAEIEGFECEPYEIRAFDFHNNFIWGRLYRVYCSGRIANVISSNMKFITGRYESFIKEHNLTRITEKRVMQRYFNEEKLGWILRYYKSDLTLNIDAFYSETFKFISSIIQYKIPFYTSFFVSILKLFLQKNASDTTFDLSCLDAKKVTLLFEDGSIYDDYSKLIDYGLSNDLVMKLHDGHIAVTELQEGKYDRALFDDYEQLLLNDFISIL